VAGPDPKSPALSPIACIATRPARFAEVTQQAGLAKTGWQGVCTGDVDGDGFVDLFVTYWGQNVLYRNVGESALKTLPPELTCCRIGPAITRAARSDYDADGDLDLFVANYLKFDFASIPNRGTILLLVS
jgi:hypothetical protein